MPLSTGTYTPPSPEYPAIPNTTILASDFNTIIEDLATALSLAIYKDGQASMAANLNMATFKVTNLGNGTNPADATNVLQVFTDPTFTGTVGTGVVLTGTTVTVTPAVLNLTVPDTNITGSTTLDLVSPDLSLTSSATIDATATTSITLTAPTIAIAATNINATGSLLATMNTATTAVLQPPGTDNSTLASTAFVQQAALAASIPNTLSAVLFYNLDYI